MNGGDGPIHADLEKSLVEATQEVSTLLGENQALRCALARAEEERTDEERRHRRTKSALQEVTILAQRLKAREETREALAGKTWTPPLTPHCVVVAVIPIEYPDPNEMPGTTEPLRGVLLARRHPNDAVGGGKLAFPGGFSEKGETWRHGLSREVREEMGLAIPEEEWIPFAVETNPEGTHTLIFASCYPRREADLRPFKPNTEVSECVVAKEPCELAFPLHTDVLRLFFDPPKWVHDRRFMGRYEHLNQLYKEHAQHVKTRNDIFEARDRRLERTGRVMLALCAVLFAASTVYAVLSVVLVAKH